MNNPQASAIKPTVDEIMRRREEFQRAVQPFNDILKKVIERIPVSGMAINMETGEMRMLPLPDEWQKKIDFILEERNRFIKSNFPEIITEPNE